jgi:RNase adaptor protein for sRNA GlmZ degradation
MSVSIAHIHMTNSLIQCMNFVASVLTQCVRDNMALRANTKFAIALKSFSFKGANSP